MSGPLLAYPWKLLPLYGLKISDDDGLKDPLFGDATLVSLESAYELVGESSDSKYAGVMIRPLTDEVFPESMPPKKYLLEVTPDSFIAVRRDKGDDAVLRAAEIRALLTAVQVLRGKRLGAFTDKPTSLAWSLEHKHIGADKHGKLHTQKLFRINEHVTLKPITLSKRDLRASWLDGSSLQPDPSGPIAWDIHQDHPLSRLLGKRECRSSWGIKLRKLACHLNDACCALTLEHQVLMAITCLEGIFCTGGNHQKLLPRLQVFAPRAPDQTLTVESLLYARNQYVHQGEALEDPEKYAKFALVMSWVFLDIAANFVIARPRQEEWEAHIEMLIHHQAAMKIMVEHYSAQVADEMRRRMWEVLESAVPGRLTAQR